ncbi:hypothetical protein Tco_0557968 [Tanacetum coccineum]
MTHDPLEGVVRFTNRTDKIAYKMPHKIEQYNSLSDLVKEHTKLVYLRNKEDKRRGVECVMRKILGFYKECLELGPEYLIGVADDEGEVTEELASPGSNSFWLSIHLVVYNEELAIPKQTATEGKLKENQGCRVDTDQVHQNGDLKNRSVWIHPPGLQDVYTKET